MVDYNMSIGGRICSNIFAEPVIIYFVILMGVCLIRVNHVDAKQGV